MNLPFKYCVILFVALLLSSCNNGLKAEKPKPDTPKALQDEKSVLSSVSDYGRRGEAGIIEELYNEQVDKTPVLKKLEDDINLENKDKGGVIDEFEKYNSKSFRYYRDANYMMFTDSSLKKRMLNLIKESNERYKQKTAPITKEMENMKGNSIKIEDYHQLLKVAVTLPLLEKYQNDNLPSNKNFENVLKEQGKIMQGEDSIITKAH